MTRWGLPGGSWRLSVGVTVGPRDPELRRSQPWRDNHTGHTHWLLTSSCERGSIICRIFQMRKLGHRQGSALAQGHTAFSRAGLWTSAPGSREAGSFVRAYAGPPAQDSLFCFITGSIPWCYQRLFNYLNL